MAASYINVNYYRLKREERMKEPPLSLIKRLVVLFFCNFFLALPQRQ